MLLGLLALAVRASAGELVLQTAHSLPVQAVALSADGRLAATAGRDGYAALWDAATGVKLRALEADRLGATAVAFSPDGALLVTGGAGSALLWETKTGRLLRRFGEPGEFLRWAAFSPDGKTVYTAGDDASIKAWDAKTGKLRAALRAEGARRLTSAALSPDGKRLAAADGTQALYVWDALTGAPEKAPSGGSEWKTVAFLSGRRLASGGEEWAAVWDLRSGLEILRVRAAAKTLAASPDGRWLATSGGNTARLWRAADGSGGRALIGHTDALTSAVFSRDGERLLTGSADGTAAAWSVASGARRVRLGAERLEPLWAAAARAGLLTVDAGSARLWDPATGRPARVSPGLWDGSCRFAASEDARVLAWRREPGLLDARDLTVTRSTSGWEAPGRAQAFALDPRGRALIAARDGRLDALDPATGREAPGGAPRLDAAALALAAGGERLVAVDTRGEISAWELPAGRRTASLRAGDSLRPAVALSSDGRLLAAAGAARTGVSTRFVLTVRALDDGRELHAWETESELRPVAFSPDGASLWTLGDGELWNWDLGTGRKLASVAIPAGAELAGAQALDARRGYAAARAGSELLLLSLASGRELARLTLTDRGWLVRARDGRLDGGGGAAVWVEGGRARPLSAAPGWTPGLLAELLR